MYINIVSKNSKNVQAHIMYINLCIFLAHTVKHYETVNAKNKNNIEL